MRATGRGGKLRMGIAAVLLTAVYLLGCGGSGAPPSSSPPAPSLPVTVTVVGPSDTLNTGAPFVFTAIAHMPETTRSTGL